MGTFDSAVIAAGCFQRPTLMCQTVPHVTP